MASIHHKPGEVVWYPADGGDEWAPCKLMATNPDGTAVVKVKGNDITVKSEDIEKILPRVPPEQLTGELTTLSCDGLGSETIEDSIRQHFCITVPYTNIDDVVVAVNPIRDVPIHDNTWVHKYAELDPSLPPHIYNVAATAYKNLQEKKQSQTLLLLGEPSAGKSRAFTNILTFLLEIAGDAEIDGRIKAFQEVLKPFLSLRLSVGSGADQFTWLSTRALTSLDLSFDQDGFICRAIAGVQALESSRVAAPGDSPNFDVLYKALRDPSSKEWVQDLDEFKLLGEEFDLEDYDKDGSELDAWKKALTTFELDAAMVVRFLCGVLLLGEMTFTESKAGGVQTSGPVDDAAKALGVQGSHLSAAFTAGGTIETSEKALASTIEDIYISLLAKVLSQANSMAVGDSDPCGTSINVVDVPAAAGVWPRALQPSSGFETLMTQWLIETVNSQLVAAAMHTQIAQLGTKGLKMDLTRLPSHVSSFRALRAIEGPKGILSKLRPLAKEAATATADSVRKEFGDWARATEREASLTTEDPMAKIIGRSPEVSCEIAGASTTLGHTLDLKLVQACIPVTIPAKVKTLLMQSSQQLVSEVVSSTAPVSISLSRGLTAAEESVSSLRSLMQGKDKKRPWLVCCMRPNDKGKFGIVSRPVLLKQAQRFCLADVVHLAVGSKQANYCMAWPLADFKKQYEKLLLADKKTTDIEACRQLINSKAAGQGTVGAETVYGTQELEKALDKELKKQASGKDAITKDAPAKKDVDVSQNSSDKSPNNDVSAPSLNRDESQLPSKKDAPEPSSKENAPEPSSKKDAPEPSSKKDVSEPSAKKDAPEPSAKKDAPEPSSKKDAPEPSSKKDVPEPSAKKDEAEPPSKKDASEPSAKKDVSEPSAKKDAPGPSSKKDAPEPSSKKHDSEPSAKKDPPEPSSKKDAAEPPSKKDVSEPSLKKDAPDPSAKKDPPEPSAKKDAPEPSLKKDAAEPSSKKDAPEPSLKKEDAVNPSLKNDAANKSLSRDPSKPSLNNQVPEASLKKDTANTSLKKDMPEQLLKKDEPDPSLKQGVSNPALKKEASEKSLAKEAPESGVVPPGDISIGNDLPGVREDLPAVRCHCGTMFDQGAQFCRNCGSKRPQVSHLVRCTTCSNVFTDDAKFCRQCGSRRPAQATDPVTCITCGNTMNGDATFCASCGAKRVESEAYASARRGSFRTRSARRATAPDSGRLDGNGRMARSSSSENMGQGRMRLLGGANDSKDPRMQNINNIVGRSPSPPSSSGDENNEQSRSGANGTATFGSPMDQERGPFRSMALAQHATLHSALSQMAAVLRVAKESETKLRSNQNAHTAELEELRAECDAWRVESDRLWVQVKELQQQAFWRAPSTA